MPHIAIYIRVSSKRQETASQEPDLQKWRQAYAGDSEVKVYTDKMTGTTMDRPAWNRLEKAMTVGDVEQIVVWRLDRLGRTAAGLTELFERLQRLGVGFVSVRDSVDLSTPAGRLMANVLASVAAYENEVRSERIRAGIEAARANGRKIGGGKAGRCISVTADQKRAIEKMLADGDPKAVIARSTGVSLSTVYRVGKRVVRT